MKIKLRGDTVTLEFHHIQVPIFEHSTLKLESLHRASDKMRYYEDNPYRTITRASIYKWDGEKQTNLLEAKSFCLWEDAFVKKIGRRISLDKLLSNSVFTREERKDVWKQYFEQTKQKQETNKQGEK